MYSCTDSFEEEIPTSQEQEDVNDQIVTNRSFTNCPNLIDNGGFETLVNNCNPGSPFHPNYSAFPNGCVTSWSCYRGTADIVNNDWNWSDPPNSFTNWQNYQFMDNWAFGCIGTSNAHEEGFYQNVSLSEDPDITYCLEFEYSSTDFEFNFAGQPNNGNNGDLTIIAQLINDNQSCDYENPDQIFHQWNVNVSDNLNYPNSNTHQEFFQLNGNPQILSFHARSSLTSTSNTLQGALYNDISLSCTSDLLTGISHTSIGCAYSFEGNFAGNLNVVSWLWDFGDPANSISSDPTPNFNYIDDGTYTVTLTIIDDRGCCTTVVDTVTCGDPEEGCDFFLCWSNGPGPSSPNHPLGGTWSGNDECNPIDQMCFESMQAFHDVEGFIIIDGLGNEVQIPFAQPYYVVGNYDEIFNEWKDILMAAPYNIPPSSITDFHPDNCNCGRVDIQFVLLNVDIIMKSFYGTDDNGDYEERLFTSPDCNFTFECQYCDEC